MYVYTRYTVHDTRYRRFSCIHGHISGLWQNLWRSAQHKFGNSELMQTVSGKFQKPAGIYKASGVFATRTQSVRVRNFWPSATKLPVQYTRTNRTLKRTIRVQWYHIKESVINNKKILYTVFP